MKKDSTWRVADLNSQGSFSLIILVLPEHPNLSSRIRSFLLFLYFDGNPIPYWEKDTFGGRSLLLCCSSPNPEVRHVCSSLSSRELISTRERICCRSFFSSMVLVFLLRPLNEVVESIVTILLGYNIFPFSLKERHIQVLIRAKTC